MLRADELNESQLVEFSAWRNMAVGICWQGVCKNEALRLRCISTPYRTLSKQAYTNDRTSVGLLNCCNSEKCVQKLLCGSTALIYKVNMFLRRMEVQSEVIRNSMFLYDTCAEYKYK